MFLKNEKGTALALSLGVVLVLFVLGGVFIIRSTGEKNMADRERLSTQVFYIADGGSQAGLNQLNTIINTNLLNTVNTTNPQVVGNDAAQFVASNDSLGFLIKYAKNAGVAQFVLNGTQAKYTGSTTALGNGNYRFDVFVSAKGNPVALTIDQWDFPYYYRVESTGTSSGAARKVVLSGDFTVRVQRDNFAKFALFTDHHTTTSGGIIWFNNNTHFYGPVHTNELFSFAKNPGANFEGIVTQQNSLARFYNNNNPFQANADTNPPNDVPVFNAGYTRSASAITLASSVQQQDMIDQARGGDTTSGNGIFVANSGGNLTGGIYVDGNSTISMSLDGSNNAVYSIVQGSTTKNITVNRATSQTTVQTVGGSTVTYGGIPDGADDVGTIVYVNGSITSLGGTVQPDTELTITNQNDVIITNHLRYADYTPASGTPGTVGYVPPNAEGATNLFGLVSWGGNIRVGTTAPNNIDIHGAVMARNGVFTVDNYSTGSPRGNINLLGGLITGYYGGVGTFDSSTGQTSHGYGRNLHYDSRMAAGKAPPYFPSMTTFIAFTNDITDKIAWQEGGF